MLQKLKQIIRLTPLLLLFPIACNGGQMNDKAVHYEKLSDVPDAVWQKLSDKKIYFGHQSVGYNILDGVRAILKENPQIQLDVEETYDPDLYKPGTIAHSQIGYNGDPKSKLDMFAFLSKAGGAGNADIMFFKFCYLDFEADTDVNALFEFYKQTFELLKRNHPKTSYIHLSVPLTGIQEGLKAKIKKALGRPVGGTAENIKRCEFNEILRATYRDKEPFVDIAAIESTLPDSRRATFESGGKLYYYLAPEYTTDGGHLNATAAKLVAEQLLITMAGTI